MGKIVAGKSAMPVDPKKSVYKTASGYSPREDVNQGPNSGGGRKSLSPGHGQNSDGGDKNDLVTQSFEQRDPYRARPQDFSVKKVSERHGQDESGAATWENRDGGGKNELAWYGPHQEGARRVEDGTSEEKSSGSPVPGDRGALVAAAFPIEANMGESSSGSTGQMGIDESVNLQEGYIECSGARTRVQEVPEAKVSIAGRLSTYPQAGKSQRNN